MKKNMSHPLVDAGYLVLKKITLDSVISTILLALQGVLGYLGLINQRGEMHGNTDGISIGMFAAIIIFNVTNTFISIKSWRENKTFPSFLKIFPYIVVAGAYILLINDCINSRGKEWWHADDIATLLLLVLFYCGYIFIETQNGKSMKTIYHNPLTWGYFSGITIGIAHVMFACRLIASHSTSGVNTEFVICTFAASSTRLIHNIVDIWLTELTPKKKALRGSESFNTVTWIIFMIIFFIYKKV